MKTKTITNQKGSVKYILKFTTLSRNYYKVKTSVPEFEKIYNAEIEINDSSYSTVYIIRTVCLNKYLEHYLTEVLKVSSIKREVIDYKEYTRIVIPDVY